MKLSAIILGFILCTSSSTAQNQNISTGVVFDGEPYIAINPTNTQHMVVAWMGWVFGNAISIRTRVTMDGGQTWSPIANIPHAVVGYGSADPSIGFDSNGNVFVSYVDYNAATLTGAVYSVKSTDGGLSWSAEVEVINTAADGSQIPVDRPWMALDISGGATDGNIYITTMNPNVFGPVPPPYNPYFMRSTDGGATYDPWKYLDTTGWLAGSLISQPMASPVVAANGTFHAAYPSYVLTQSIFPQYILASSTDGGNSFSYQTIIASANTFSDSLAKKTYLLRANPADANHLIFLYIAIDHGDGDVFMLESFNAGGSWGGGIRINDDPIGNNRMQDLIWADFDIDGDLVITWRDRRNGTDSTYMTATEMWGAVRWKDSTNFSTNFLLSDGSVAYGTVLAGSGNDFMCVKFANDTLNAVWGDTRTGRLNIWFERIGPNGMVASLQNLSSEKLPQLDLYPNPATTELFIEGFGINEVVIYNPAGQIVLTASVANNPNYYALDISKISSGTYMIQVKTNEGIVTKKFIKP